MNHFFTQDNPIASQVFAALPIVMLQQLLDNFKEQGEHWNYSKFKLKVCIFKSNDLGSEERKQLLDFWDNFRKTGQLEELEHEVGTKRSFLFEVELACLVQKWSGSEVLW